MNVTIESIPLSETENWDRFVENHDNATVYHLSGWSRIIEKTYGHKAHLFAAMNPTGRKLQRHKKKNEIVGILPIVKHRDLLLRPSLISMPFCDLGGAVADSADIQRRLIFQAIMLGEKVGARQIELRNTEENSKNVNLQIAEFKKDLFYSEEKKRFRLLLKLPHTSAELMGSLKSKLRSQIRRPLKAGFTAEVGKTELVDDFYAIFLSNMRDLGSPVHSKRLFINVFEELDDMARIFIVKNNGQPIAGSVTLGFRGTMYNPWASSLRQYSKDSPNMLLYWKMQEFACDNGFKFFDFGRSSLNEGTYKFKMQWGATPLPLPWQYISRGKDIAVDSISECHAFQTAGEIWKRFPVGLTKIIGPHLRKYVGL